MPPKRKVYDPKLRKLSDFWVVPVPAVVSSSQTSSSNPFHNSSPDRSRSSSPSKRSRASPSEPTMAQSRLARAGSLRIDPPRTPSKKPQQTTLPFATNRTPMASSSNIKPSPSPKFIVIDDDEPGSPPLRQSTQAMSRKRPRDVDAKPSSLTARPSTTSTQGRQVVDLTLTPPPKRRALSKPADPALPTPLEYSVTLQQYCTPISSADDVVPCSVSTYASPLNQIASPLKVAGMSTSSLPTPYLGTPISRKPDVATLPTPEASSPVSRLDFHTAPLTSSMTIEERTKARLEEIRQQVKAKTQAARAIERKTIYYVPDDDDDDDDLVFNFGPLKTATSRGPNAKQGQSTVREAEPSITTQKRAEQSSSTVLPLIDPGCDSSDNETTWPPVVCRAATRKAPPVEFRTRLTRNSPFTSSSASISESLSAPKAKPAAPQKKERGKKDSLSLESLLGGTTRSLNSGRKTNKEIEEMVNRDLAELERRQLGGITSSEASDDEVEDEDVDETVHERVLGAEQAGKVSKMLKSDKCRIIKVLPWRPFWAANNGSSGKTVCDNFTIPPLDLRGDLHPTLKRVVHENEIRILSFILTPEFLLAFPSESTRQYLTTWLFRLATAVGTPPELARAAVNALTNLYPPRASQIHTNRGQIHSAPEFCLNFGDILQVVSNLGPEPDAFNKVVSVSQVDPPSHTCSKEVREAVLFRLLGMLRAVSCAGVFLRFIDTAVLVFALISLDGSTSDALRRDIQVTIEDMITSLECAPRNTASVIELSICNSLLNAALGFRSIEKEKLLSLIVGGSVRSRRVVRWTAFGLLLSRSSLSLSEDLFLEPPPLQEVAALLDQSSKEDVRFRVRKDTDYGELVSWTVVLGICLNDVVVYHKSQPALLETIITHLNQMHSAIQDGKAAFLDRTRAKDMIQRLKMRLYYQRPGATKARLTDHFSARDSV